MPGKNALDARNWIHMTLENLVEHEEIGHPANLAILLLRHNERQHNPTRASMMFEDAELEVGPIAAAICSIDLRDFKVDKASSWDSAQAVEGHVVEASA